MPHSARLTAAEPIDPVRQLVEEIDYLVEANKTTHLLVRDAKLHLSEPLRAQIDLLDELIQGLKLKVNALKR